MKLRERGREEEREFELVYVFLMQPHIPPKIV